MQSLTVSIVVVVVFVAAAGECGGGEDVDGELHSHPDCYGDVDCGDE